MPDYLSVTEFPDANCISITLFIESDELMTLGEQLNAVCDEAYMNGENWNALLTAYLEKNAPELLEELEPDPEAGMYAAEYPLTNENRIKAQQLSGLIVSLVSEPERLRRFVAEHAEEIEWD